MKVLAHVQELRLLALPLSVIRNVFVVHVFGPSNTNVAMLINSVIELKMLIEAHLETYALFQSQLMKYNSRHSRIRLNL